MWAHQYDQQVNQVECSVDANRCWNTNGPGANLFGLHSECACCTANFSQGWPKFVASMWMQSAEGDLVALAHGPSILSTTVKGVDVRVESDTGYPFRDNIRLSVSVASPVAFGLRLRIPAWAGGATHPPDRD